MRFMVIGMVCLFSVAHAKAQGRIRAETDTLWQQAEAMRQAGHAFFNAKDYRKALGKYQRALVMFKNIGDSARMAKCYNNIGNSQLFLGNNIEAVTAFYNAIKFNKRLENFNSLVSNYLNLATYYWNQGEFKQALRYYLAAKDVVEEIGDEDKLVFIYNGLADLLASEDNPQKNYQLAQSYYLKALDRYTLQQDSARMAVVYNNLGVLLDSRGIPDSSLYYYQKSIALKQSLYDERGQIVAMLNIGNIYMDQGNYGLALNYYQKGAELALLHNDKVTYHDLLTNILKCKIKLGETKEADSLFVIYNSLNDSIYNQEKAKSLKELEVMYETQKIGQDLQEQIKETQAKTKLSYWYLAFAVGAVLLLFITILFFLQRQRFQQKLKANEMDRLKQQQQITAMEALMRGQEDERARIARDLHDSVGARLSIIKLSALRTGEEHPALIEMIDACIKETRDISHNLSTDILNRFGLVSAIKDMVRVLSETKSLEGEFTSFDIPDGLPRDFAKTVYNIVVELVNNTIKHSGSPKFYIQLNGFENELTVNYEDFGRGFDFEKERNSGMGLSTMFARADSIHAHLHFDTVPGDGVQVVLTASYPKVAQSKMEPVIPQ